MSLKDTIYDTLHFHKGTQFSMNVVVVVVFAISEGQSLKKEFAELQIQLYSVENMSPNDFTLSNLSVPVNPFSFRNGGGVLYQKYTLRRRVDH